MDFDEYETLPTKNFLIHMTAGAIAGVLEHCVMYPFDSVKTRMQSLSPQVNYSNPIQGLTLVVRQEGVFRLFRGMGVVMAGAGPAHAMYFSIYEHLKGQIQESSNKPSFFVNSGKKVNERKVPSPAVGSAAFRRWIFLFIKGFTLFTAVYSAVGDFQAILQFCLFPVLLPLPAAGFSGMVATLFHDGVMTPTEVVKQRMQMYNSPYSSILDCISRTYRAEGFRAFYRSYTTQLAMNIPFQIIHFMTYEGFQSVTNKERVYNPKAHVISGGIAGALAAALTTPLDVVKTLLNTQQHKVKGMVAGIKTVYKVSGIWGFWKGLYPRVLYQVPSTAICWSVYELFKYILSSQKLEVKCTEKSLTPTVLLSDRPISLSPVLLLPEVNLEPYKPSEQNLGFESVVTSDYDSLSWSNSIPETLHEDLIGNHKTAAEFGLRPKEKCERTFFEKSDWGSSIMPGADVFG